MTIVFYGRLTHDAPATAARSANPLGRLLRRLAGLGTQAIAGEVEAMTRPVRAGPGEGSGPAQRPSWLA